MLKSPFNLLPSPPLSLPPPSLPSTYPLASSTPFFLYFAFQHTHEPQFASKQFTNSTMRGPFGDSLAELDWAVGSVISTLQEAGVDDNTFMFFTSDNG